MVNRRNNNDRGVVDVAYHAISGVVAALTSIGLVVAATASESLLTAIIATVFAFITAIIGGTLLIMARAEYKHWKQ